MYIIIIINTSSKISHKYMAHFSRSHFPMTNIVVLVWWKLLLFIFQRPHFRAVGLDWPRIGPLGRARAELHVDNVAAVGLGS